MGPTVDSSQQRLETTRRPFAVAVASGKGGTGKTLVATNLAVWAARKGPKVALVDCDADAPNDHLFLLLAATLTSQVEAVVAEVDHAACTACGLCRDACAFGAMRVLGSSAIVFEELCHGCELCVRVCPVDAVHLVRRRVGVVNAGDAERHDGLRLFSGVLDIGQVKAPDVIRAAVSAGMSAGADLVVLDAPPGVACSVVAAVSQADALLLVTEPTPFGLHDLELALQLGEGLDVPMAIVVNKAGEESDAVERLAAAHDVPVLCRIPFDRRIAEVYATGRLVADEPRISSEWLDAIVAWIDEVATAPEMLEVTRG